MAIPAASFRRKISSGKMSTQNRLFLSAEKTYPTARFANMSEKS
jgi:hypothetical protein